MRMLVALFLFLLVNTSFVMAQSMDFDKSYSDLVFSKDEYNKAQTDFSAKKTSYLNNKTLSLKEDLRLSFVNFLQKRNILIKSYLTVIRAKIATSQDLLKSDQETAFTNIDPEVVWYENYQQTLRQSSTLEALLVNSKELDERYGKESSRVIRYTLYIATKADVVRLQNQHMKIYNDLKNEATSIIASGKADQDLFTRWFNDIENEYKVLDNIVLGASAKASAILSSSQGSMSERAYGESMDILSESKQSLLKINRFQKELDATITLKK